MIYCLNRGRDAQIRQMKSFAQKGLNFNGEKITYLQYDLSNPDLGLKQKIRSQLPNDSLRTAIYRLGQIAGPTTTSGAWNQREWIPSLIASSVHIGKLPASLGSRDLIDWIPVDIAARIIVDLIWPSEDQSRPESRQLGGPAAADTLCSTTSTAPDFLTRDSSDMQSQVEQTMQSGASGPDSKVDDLLRASSKGTSSAAVYNIVNPSTITWPTIIPTIKSAYAVKLDIISFPE
ncbi:MAG: hypothetical protein Q9175_005888 [Cornicularia normoerica]